VKRWDDWATINREAIEKYLPDAIREEGINPDSELGRIIADELRRRANTPSQVAQLALAVQQIVNPRLCDAARSIGLAVDPVSNAVTVPDGWVEPTSATIEAADDPDGIGYVLRWLGRDGPRESAAET